MHKCKRVYAKIGHRHTQTQTDTHGHRRRHTDAHSHTNAHFIWVTHCVNDMGALIPLMYRAREKHRQKITHTHHAHAHKNCADTNMQHTSAEKKSVLKQTVGRNTHTLT